MYVYKKFLVYFVFNLRWLSAVSCITTLMDRYYHSLWSEPATIMESNQYTDSAWWTGCCHNLLKKTWLWNLKSCEVQWNLELRKGIYKDAMVNMKPNWSYHVHWSMSMCSTPLPWQQLVKNGRHWWSIKIHVIKNNYRGLLWTTLTL